MNVRTEFEVRSYRRSWDNRGYSKKLGSPWICPRFLFSKIFHGLLFGWTLLLFWPNWKFVALPVPEIIAIGVLAGGCGPRPGEEEAVGGRGCYRSKERWWVPIGPLYSIVTFPLSLRVSEILPLLCSSTPLFPTSPVVSPKFPYVSLRAGRWPLGDEERRSVQLISNLCGPDPPTWHRRTDRQMDDLQSHYRSLHYSASRDKNCG